MRVFSSVDGSRLHGSRNPHNKGREYLHFYRPDTMANPPLSHLLHADQAHPQQHHHQQQHHQQHHQHHQPPQPGQSPSAGNLSASLHPISTGFTYPPPPSTASPAASGTSNALATPAASPTAQHTPGSASGSASGTVPKSHANNTSLYQCADCLKRYSRPEHLQRHIATHTLGKRFVCDVSPTELAKDGSGCLI